MDDYEVWRWVVTGALSGCAGAYIAILNKRQPVIWGVICFLTAGLGFIALMLLGKAPEPRPLRGAAWDIDLNKAPAPVPASSSNPASSVRPEQAWWDHLKDIDPDVRQAADEVARLSPAYEDVLADRFLTPTDKKDHLRSLVEELRAAHAARVEPPVGEEDAGLQAKRKLALEKRLERSKAMMAEIAANGMVCRQTGKKVALMQLYAGQHVDDHGYAYLRYEDGTRELRSGDYFKQAPSDEP
jgi:hypothetical protein